MPLLKARRPDHATVAGHVAGPGIEVAWRADAMLEVVGLTAVEAGRRAGMRKNT